MGGSLDSDGVTTGPGVVDGPSSDGEVGVLGPESDGADDELDAAVELEPDADVLVVGGELTPSGGPGSTGGTAGGGDDDVAGPDVVGTMTPAPAA